MNNGLVDWRTVGSVSVLGLDCADDAELGGALESAESCHRVISLSSSPSLR